MLRDFVCDILVLHKQDREREKSKPDYGKTFQKGGHVCYFLYFING